MTGKEKSEIVSYRIKNARKTFNEIQILVENQMWNTAMNRLYYSCYYAVIALLVSIDVKTLTHSGVRRMFSLHFVKTGHISQELSKFYSDLFDMRHSGDYGDFFDFEKEDVLSFVEPARKLIGKIEKLLK